MNRKPTLVDQVASWLHLHAIGQGPTVVAVSGGPDSVALLRALLFVRPGERSILAHLNHRLRGDESVADEQFVRELHAHLRDTGSAGLELRCDRIDVNARLQEAGGNLEATAREIRYDWLTRIAQECGAAWIATGHTLDDQAETVLHRLLRGTGLRGLRGIQARRRVAAGIEVIRPLLGASRREVLDYLASQNQLFREDRTNEDVTFTRNRLRRQLLPRLTEDYNPAVREALAGLSEDVDEVYHDLEERARQLLGAAERPSAGGMIVLDRATLAGVARLLVREALRLIWERQNWPQREMSRTQWKRLVALTAGSPPALDLPGGVQARCRERVVQMSRSRLLGGTRAS